MTRFATTALAAALVTACAAGPDLVRPQVAVSERFGAAARYKALADGWPRLLPEREKIAAAGIGAGSGP
ncbi:MAG TPA: hypothetical protein PLS34_05050 [Gammaproteobacteria bacterium]|nr:hypothetical protein [Gammaproteobacteria bacterium]